MKLQQYRISWRKADKPALSAGKGQRIGILVGSLLLSLLLAPLVMPVLAQVGGGYDLTWNTIDGGGATSLDGGGYTLGGTIGQPDAGTLTGGGYELCGGFWCVGDNAPTPTPTATATPTPTSTASHTLTPTPTSTASHTLTPTPTSTASHTLTPTPTSTSTSTTTRTNTVTPTPTNTSGLTNTPTTCPFGAGYTVANSVATIVPGTTDIGNHCDDCGTVISLPFPVTLYDQTFTSVQPGSNGYLSFGTVSNSFYNGCLPNASFTYTIFPFETDQITSATGNYGIFTLATGSVGSRIFYIEWRACRFSSATTCVANSDNNYEVVFTEGQTSFQIVYGTFGSANATVGAIGVQKNISNVTQSQCNVGAPASGAQTYSPGCLQPTNTPTITNTRTNTNTPAITNTPTNTLTPTNTPAPLPTCGANANYVTTTGAGTLIGGITDTGNHCDDCATSGIIIPFTFNLYGQPFTTVNVDSNGTLQFSSAASSFTNTCLPSVTFNNAIFPHWDDLNTSANPACPTGCGIFTQTVGSPGTRQFIIEWRAVYFGTSTYVNFELRLHEETGSFGESFFDIFYNIVPNSGVGATSGVQKGTGTQFTQYSCNTAILTPGLLVSYAQPICTPPTLTFTNTPANTATSTSTSTFMPSVVPTGTPTGTNVPTITSTVTPPGIPASLVISQVYGGGGNTGAPWHNDFVELFNRSSVSVDITGWSVQYASASGAFTPTQTTVLNGAIPPGGYFLIQEAAGAGSGSPLPAPDVTGTISMAQSNGKVALVSSTTALRARAETR